MPPVLLAERPPSSVLTPVEDTTRRRFITGVGAAALAAAFLAACGDEDAGGTPAPTSTPEVRSIEHQYGVTEISGVPERVVTVGWVEQDALLALGVVPVATTEWVGDPAGAIHPGRRTSLVTLRYRRCSPTVTGSRSNRSPRSSRT